MDDDGRCDDECRYDFDGRLYEWTSETFTKYELLHDQPPTDVETDQLSTLPPLRESMLHEIQVYRLLARYTDIPVPKKIYRDSDDAGRAYIRIERIDGTVRASAALGRCCMPLRHGTSSSSEEPCERCAAAIRRSADDFVHCTVLPKLRKLRSRTRGLDGFVVPRGGCGWRTAGGGGRSRRGRRTSLCLCCKIWGWSTCC